MDCSFVCICARVIQFVCTHLRSYKTSFEKEQPIAEIKLIKCKTLAAIFEKILQV